MKKIFFIVALLGCAMVYLQQQSYADKKTSHTEYATLEIKECNSCHKGEGVALNHDADFVRGHRVLASKAGNNCKECHQQTFCLDCHQGGGSGSDLAVGNFGRDYKPKSHRSNFRTFHPLKAKDNQQSCLRCHDQKYCSECHSKFRGEDVQFESHRKQFRDIRFSSGGGTHAAFINNNGSVNTATCSQCHTQGFNLDAHSWAGNHSREARRNLQACQTCHSDGDVCITCHGARSGLKISPHPRNWGSVKDNFRSKSNGRSCVRCHDKY